ncbi:MAG: ABC transporter permease [Candidatus Hydrogenedentes bacterium]|nr:ABC transporter permease [Candidatus Hydrogenedentota bacterium]
MKQFISRNALIILLGVVCLGLAVFTPSFISDTNLTNLARRVCAVGIVAVGETLVIITAGIDLSVGSVAAFSAVVAGKTIQDLGIPVPLGIIAGAATGLFCGLVNGVLSTKGRIPSFIVTLGMMLAARGGALLLTGGSRISGLPEGFRFLGGTNDWRVPVVVTLLIVGVFAAMLRYMRLGREIYASGGNLQGARLSGIPVDRCRIAAFALCGMLAGFAGVLLASRTGVADPTMAEGMELDSIAACVVGGASLMGGEGGAVGALVGAVLIGMLINICQLNGMSDEWQRIVVGVLIVVLVYIDNMRKRRAGKLKD